MTQATSSPHASVPDETSGVSVPPPLIYAAGLALGLSVDRLLQAPGLPPWVGRPTGAALVVGGTLLGGLFIREFRRARTAIDLRKPSTSLVTSGPYRLSRNPGYLSLTLIYLGAAAAVGGPWSLAILVAVVAAVDRLVIRREESYLGKRFGADYRAYRARVRRWL